MASGATIAILKCTSQHFGGGNILIWFDLMDWLMEAIRKTVRRQQLQRVEPQPHSDLRQAVRLATDWRFFQVCKVSMDNCIAALEESNP